MTMSARMQACVVALAAGLLLVPPSTGESQESEGLPVSASLVLELLGSEDLETRARGKGALRALLRRRPSPREIDRLVVGLEDLSRSGAVLPRSAAVAGLVTWAEWSGGGARPLQVLVRVFDQMPEGSEGEKGLILMRLSGTFEGPEVIGFLRRVAASESAWEGIPGLAVEALADLGEPGRAALRTLHENGEVEPAIVRERLEDLARNGYRKGGD